MTMRRRLLWGSAPVVAILLLAIVKLVSVVVTGNSAVAAWADRDTDALRSAVATLEVANLVQPAKATFAAGGAAVLEGRLEDADKQFAKALDSSTAAGSCPVRVNLELVRETLGDRAAGNLDGQSALAYYLSARIVVEQAPQGCFSGNSDPDDDRREVREDALERLDAKINTAQIPPPPPPPPPAAVASVPPPPALQNGPDERDSRLRLYPETGDALERLQQILGDAAAHGGG